MRYLFLILLLTAALAPYGSYSTDYFTHTQNYYYPSEYIGPAWTGLPSKSYYYPGRFKSTFGSFREYRHYTHQAIRDPYRLPYHVPYTGPLNPRYFN